MARLSKDERRQVIERAAVEVFARHGYRGAAMDEIARRSGVTVPVVYDHFASKLELYRRVLERVRDGLLAMWREHLDADAPDEVRVPKALEGWARFVEEHREETRMYFREAEGDPEAEAVHREIKEQARAGLGVIFGMLPAGERLAGGPDAESLEMAAEIVRAGLVGLALWWYEHQDVPRERIVHAAVNVLWVGYRSAAGQTMR